MCIFTDQLLKTIKDSYDLREKVFLDYFTLLNLYRFTVLSGQINAKPQCKHLDFENFGGVSFSNSNYWFYIIFSQGN